MITASRNGTSVRAFEEPVVLVVTLNRKTTLVHELVMLRTQQHQVVEACLATDRPVLNVMRVDKALVVTAGERTTFVPGREGTFDSRRHGAGFATDIQRLSVLVFAKDDRMTVAAQSFDALDGEASSTVPVDQCRLIDVDRHKVVI